MKLTTFALAALSLSPALMAQSQHGTVDFTRAPRARVAQQAQQAQQADTPPKLGVMVSETDDGVLISEIFEGSLAEHAGIQPEDILFKIGGSRVGEVADIPALLAEVAPGGNVTLTVIRPGEGLVTLRGRRPAPPPPPAPAPAPVEQPDQAWVHEGGGAFLGVEIGAADGKGVRVVGVIDGTAAWYVGLSEGDTLLALDGQKINAPEDLAELVGRHAPGDLIGMTYRHGEKRYETRLRLGDRTGSGNPLGALFGPGGHRVFGDPDANSFFGQSGDALGKLQFLGRDSGVQVFGGDGGVWFSDDGHDGPDSHHAWSSDEGHDGHDVWISDDAEQELHEHARGKETHGLVIKRGQRVDAPDGGPREVKVQIQNGVMTVIRDGEVEVIELKAKDKAKGKNKAKAGQRTSFLVHPDQGHDVTASVIALTSDLEAECDALVAECDALAAECDALAVECDAMAVECDTAAEAQVQTIALAVAQAQDACAQAAAECAEVAAECADVTAEACESACEDEAAEAECSAAEVECCDDADDCGDAETVEEDAVT